MKRVFDFVLALFIFTILAIPMLLVALVIRLNSKGPALYWSQRVGKDNLTFLMPKFRSMKINTPQVATYLLTNLKIHLTVIGDFIRKTSIDELPQLISVIACDMSFVGPRPALFNQTDLITLRTKNGIHILKPGITGWAQINGLDEISIPDKVKLDEYYLKNQSFYFDFKILFLTGIKVILSKNVTH